MRCNDALCRCNYNQSVQGNICNCSLSNMTSLPTSLPEETNIFVVENSSYLNNICCSSPEINSIREMVFVQNNISSLCRSFINSVKRSQTLKVLNLAKNKIQRVPKSLQNLFSLEQLWLGGNPFHCDCDMEWMIHWINNFNSTSISHIIMDIDNIRCRSGNWIEEQISQLTPADFGKIGCYSWTKVQKISVGIASIVVVLLIAGSVYATKRHHELKFYLFYYFKMDTIPKDDPSEDLTNIEYDAFFCFW